MASSEAAEIAPLSELQTYLEEAIQDIEVSLQKRSVVHQVDWELLNQFFLEELGMV